ncbi:MAG: HEAT repeat protein [Myxococcota bacterium]|jgi:HEAT repeat protein
MKGVISAVFAVSNLLLPCLAQQADLATELLTLEILRQDSERPGLVNGQLYLIAQINSDDAAIALEKLVDDLSEDHRYIAISALGVNDSLSATKALEDLAKRRSDLRVRRQAIRVLANGTEENLIYLRDKRLKYESDLRLRALILNLLSERDMPDLDKFFLSAAKSKDTVYSGAGLTGIGKLKLKRGLKRIHGALTSPDVQYRITAYTALASYGGEQQYQAILEGLQASINIAIRPKLSAQLQRASTTEEINTIIKNGLLIESPAVVMICVKAIAVISKTRPQLCADALLKFLNRPEDTLRSLAIEGLVQIKTDGLQLLLVDLLDHPSPQTRADAAWGLSQLGDLPPETEIKLVKMSSSERPSIRIQSLNALRWFPDSELAFQAISDALEDELWSVRSVAVSALELFRRDESLKPLLWLIANEVGRVRNDALRVITLLTGEDFGPSIHVWKSWREDKGDSYTLPSKVKAESMIAARKNNKRHGNETVAQSGYHGITVPAGGVVFVLDISGSMNSRFSADETYYQHFSKALGETVQALGNDTSFNIVLFSSGVRTWKNKLVASTEENRSAAELWLKQNNPGGATNLFGALSAALSFDEAQTIFIMTDGDPTAGEYQVPESILAEIDRINRDRMVQIHTIAAGNVRAEFLADLAATNGGKAVDLRKNKKKVL